VPASHVDRTKPNFTNAVPFDINEIDPPAKVRSFVTLSDAAHWGNARIECVEANSGRIESSIDTRTIVEERCGCFEHAEGRWKFTGSFSQAPPSIREKEGHFRVPVHFVRLDVVP
jgi:hypothetical protein